MKKIFYYIIWLIIVTLTMILSIEGMGRAIIHFRYGIPGKTYGLWKYDPELGATHRDNAYNTMASLNNHGFRNKEDVFEPKPANSLRIIALGGSTTFGYSLKDGETYTEILEAKLRKIPGYEKTQVLNAGRICYSVGHNLILAKRLIPKWKPDYAIIYEGLNEITNSVILQNEGVKLEELRDKFGVLGKGYDINSWFKHHSIIVRFIDYKVKQYIISMRSKIVKENAEKEDVIVVHPWTIENYKYLLEKMIDYLLEEEVKPIVIRYAIEQNPELKIFSDISAEIAQNKGVLIYDMQSHFNNTKENTNKLFTHTGAHVTPKGAKIMAEGIFNIIYEDLENRKL